MKSIAIIPARGGSKRIPDKNIRDFFGKPIIAYSILSAIESGCFEEVMVSTDDENISRIAQGYGASVPFLRSAKNSDDYATIADVIIEVLGEYKKNNKKFDAFCVVYPTAPLLNGKKLSDAMKLFETKGCDGVISVTLYSFPPQRGFFIQDGFVQYMYPEHEKTRSQDLQKVYHDAGQFVICHSQSFISHHTLVLPNTVPYIIREEEVQDIDNESDWKIAEMKYKIFQDKHMKM